MATQGRNELCGCGRGKKYKKCCGRFTLQEMTAKLAAYAATNKQKNKLIERSLKFLKACEIDGSGRVPHPCQSGPEGRHRSTGRFLAVAR